MADTRKQRRERAAKEARTIVPAATVERALNDALARAADAEFVSDNLHQHISEQREAYWVLEAAYDKAREHVQELKDTARAHIIWAAVGGAVIGALMQLAA